MENGAGDETDYCCDSKVDVEGLSGISQSWSAGGWTGHQTSNLAIILNGRRNPEVR